MHETTLFYMTWWWHFAQLSPQSWLLQVHTEASESRINRCAAAKEGLLVGPQSPMQIKILPWGEKMSCANTQTPSQRVRSWCSLQRCSRSDVLLGLLVTLCMTRMLRLTFFSNRDTAKWSWDTGSRDGAAGTEGSPVCARFSVFFVAQHEKMLTDCGTRLSLTNCVLLQWYNTSRPLTCTWLVTVAHDIVHNCSALFESVRQRQWAVVVGEMNQIVAFFLRSDIFRRSPPQPLAVQHFKPHNIVLFQASSGKRCTSLQGSWFALNCASTAL